MSPLALAALPLWALIAALVLGTTHAWIGWMDAMWRMVVGGIR